MTLRLKVERDDALENPRAWGTGATLFLAWHKQYKIGDPHPAGFSSIRDFGGWEELEKALRDNFRPVALLPVYLLDHSGVAYSTEPFSDPWDSGQVGFILALPSDEWKGVGPEAVRDALRGEIATYSAWANGDVWGYTVQDDDRVLDSAWGLYGEAAAREEGEAALNAHLSKEVEAEVEDREKVETPETHAKDVPDEEIWEEVALLLTGAYPANGFRTAVYLVRDYAEEGRKALAEALRLAYEKGFAAGKGE